MGANDKKDDLPVWKTFLLHFFPKSNLQGILQEEIMYYELIWEIFKQKWKSSSNIIETVNDKITSKRMYGVMGQNLGEPASDF